MRSGVIGAIVALACLGFGLAGRSEVPGQEADSSRTRLPEVAVQADGSVIGLATPAATVGELLEAIGVSLGSLDRTRPAPQTPIADGLEVQVTRVARRQVVEETAIPSQTVVLADPDRPAGFTKILSHGRQGRVRRVWRVWTKDGQETCRGIVSHQVLEAAADTVVLRGTRGLPTRGGNWHRPLVMTATAYDPGPRSCGRHADGYTATGVKAKKGVVAVDDRVIPMGSRLYVPGYGFAVAADRGSAIKGMRIDLCFPTYREALAFGRRKVKVYLLD